jgi:hypothetical protein
MRLPIFTRPSRLSYSKSILFAAPASSFRITTTGTCFSRTRAMSDLVVQLTAPNGRTYAQPTGLFIGNEWVRGGDGDMIGSVNPT